MALMYTDLDVRPTWQYMVNNAKIDALKSCNTCSCWFGECPWTKHHQAFMWVVDDHQPKTALNAHNFHTQSANINHLVASDPSTQNERTRELLTTLQKNVVRLTTWWCARCPPHLTYLITSSHIERSGEHKWEGKTKQNKTKQNKTKSKASVIHSFQSLIRGRWLYVSPT